MKVPFKFNKLICVGVFKYNYNDPYFINHPRIIKLLLNQQSLFLSGSNFRKRVLHCFMYMRARVYERERKQDGSMLIISMLNKIK